jgi:hypothetical protein
MTVMFFFPSEANVGFTYHFRMALESWHRSCGIRGLPPGFVRVKTALSITDQPATASNFLTSIDPRTTMDLCFTNIPLERNW